MLNKNLATSQWHMDPYSDLKRTADFIEEQSPGGFKLLYPRRYITPLGYPSPKMNVALTTAQLLTNHPECPSNLTKTSIDYLLCDWRLIECEVPTYFVGLDFVQALVKSTPPEDFLVKHLKWPHQAMLFVLPEAFSRAYFNQPVPFIRVARVPTGKQNPPFCVHQHFPQKVGVGLGYHGSWGIIITASCLYGDKAVDYSGSYSENDSVKKLIHDTDFSNDLNIPETFYKHTKPPTQEEDIQFCQRMMTLGVQLILAMGSLPQYVDKDVLERPARFKNGKLVKRELWRPKMFGGNYILRRPKHAPEGTHASPILHYRKAHWRSQACGKNWEDRRAIWIDETWVGVDNEVNDEKKNP